MSRGTNWLFVALDSDRNIGKIALHLQPMMQKEGIRFWTGAEGLWLPFNELLKPLVTDRVVVPFSACYIFGAEVTSCPKPIFTSTTDSGLEFTENARTEVASELRRLNALCYAADGCGLQCVMTDENSEMRLLLEGLSIPGG